MIRSHFGKQNPFIRNIDASHYFEIFLISAASSILVIRSFLYLTGYPTIGGESLHIAHMLWGGLFMLIAMVLLIGYLNKGVYNLAAALGGIGFGTFIDELGKFLTADNNYFFQPTIALIYMIFILLYILIRPVQKLETFTKDEYLINSLKIFEEAIFHDLDKDEKKRALKLLRKSNQNDIIVQTVKKLLLEFETIKSPTLGPYSRLRNQLKDLYEQFAHSRWFAEVITALFIVQQITVGVFLIVELNITMFAIANGIIPRLSFMDAGFLFSAFLSLVFLITGVGFLRRNRLKGLRLLKLSLMISIFLTQFFAFYRVQFQALTFLIINLSLYASIDYMIDREEAMREPDEG